MIFAMVNLLFANAFNLVTSKILSFGKGLNLRHVPENKTLDMLEFTAITEYKINET